MEIIMGRDMASEQHDPHWLACAKQELRLKCSCSQIWSAYLHQFQKTYSVQKL